jgi:hypothetical protein
MTLQHRARCACAHSCTVSNPRLAIITIHLDMLIQHHDTFLAHAHHLHCTLYFESLSYFLDDESAPHRKIHGQRLFASPRGNSRRLVRLWLASRDTALNSLCEPVKYNR